MSGKGRIGIPLAIIIYIGLLIWGFYQVPKQPTIGEVQDQLAETQRELDRANKLLEQIIGERNNDDDPNNDIILPPDPAPKPEQNTNATGGFSGGGASGDFSEPGGPGPTTGSNTDNSPTPQALPPDQPSEPPPRPSPTPTAPPDPEPEPISPLLPAPICNVSVLGSIVCN